MYILTTNFFQISGFLSNILALEGRQGTRLYFLISKDPKFYIALQLVWQLVQSVSGNKNLAPFYFLLMGN